MTLNIIPTLLLALNKDTQVLEIGPKYQILFLMMIGKNQLTKIILLKRKINLYRVNLLIECKILAIHQME